MEVLICELNHAASHRWLQAGRVAPRLSAPTAPSSASGADGQADRQATPQDRLEDWPEAREAAEALGEGNGPGL